jgi:carnitine 3-dehydrogenase
VRHVAEARALEALYVTTQVLELDDKRLRLFHSLHRRRDDALVATAEQLYLHVSGGRAAALDPEVHACLERVRGAHARLALPPHSGRVGTTAAR